MEPKVQAVKPFRMHCPVVIPQRRPGSKTRGFIRAYAPMLSDYDIDQETFLTLLKSFQKASHVCHSGPQIFYGQTGGVRCSARSTQRLIS